jgi:hypothetical protein
MPEFGLVTASVLVKSLVGMLLFVIGLPIVAYQIGLPTELRFLFRKYWWAILRPLVIPVTVLLMLLALFIWHMPPYSCTGCFVCRHHWILFIFALVLTGCFGAYVSVLGRLVRLLGSKLVGDVNSDVLEDFYEIGFRCSAGSEKSHVLKEFKRIFSSVQTEDHYRGSELEFLLRRFHKLLTTDENPAVTSNFDFAIGILANVRKKAQLASRNANDNKLAVLSLEALAVYALQHGLSIESEGVMKEISDCPVALHRVGRSAIALNQKLCMVSALSKLEILAQRAHSKDGEEVIYYLALVAELWTRRSDSLRREASDSLEACRSNLEDTIPAALVNAAKSFREKAEFRTADTLLAMLYDIEK